MPRLFKPRYRYVAGAWINVKDLRGAQISHYGDRAIITSRYPLRMLDGRAYTPSWRVG